MVQIDQLAEAALRRDSLALRSLTQDFLRTHPDLSDIVRPQTSDARVLAAAAALIELFALRRSQAAPTWVDESEPMAEPFFLVAAALTMKRLRATCEAEAPEALRKHGFYAPADFLDFA